MNGDTNKKLAWVTTLLSILVSTFIYAQEPDSVYFTTGIKFGEVSDTSIIVWTRLCATKTTVPVGHERKSQPYAFPLNFDDDQPIHQMDGAVVGAEGEIKLTFTSADTTIVVEWEQVFSNTDFTYKKQVVGLKSNTPYQVVFEGRSHPDKPVTSYNGSFTTLPKSTSKQAMLFTASSCQYYWDFDDKQRGFGMYDAMQKLKPSFHCQTGDYVYYDLPGPLAKTKAKARHKWHAMNSWPALVDFYAQTPVFMQKDDHDVLKNDACPLSTNFGEFSFSNGVAIWYEQNPITPTPYRTKLLSENVQIWFLESREYRSYNWDEDSEQKTILGENQKQWLVKSLDSSKAKFKIIMSSTPIVGPDRTVGKTDNHANDGYAIEGNWLRKLLAKHQAIVINGDMHWQYVSKDPETGLLEFSTGPSSNAHATGWKQEDRRPAHQFLRVNGGFVSVQYSPESNGLLVVKHHDVEGNVVNETSIER